jgi:hypothetical protein
MKINLRSACASRGHVLIATIVITGFLMVGIAANLALINYEYSAASRSESWNKAIAVSEAGVEEAYAHINVNGFDRYSPNGWAMTSNGWWKQRYLGSNYYLVTIVTNGAPSLLSVGYVRIPPSTNYLKRTVQVSLVNQGMWRGAMLAKDTIVLLGNGVSSDSFNSTNAALSSNGQYDPAKRAANGDIASNSRLPNCVQIGNGNVYGHVSTGPGGTVSYGANGGVGDLNWNTSGIQSNYWRSDMNVALKDVVWPSSIPDQDFPDDGSVNGVYYNMIFGSHNYLLASLSLSGKQKVMINGNAVIYVTSDISMSGMSSITINTNATLVIYMKGASTSIGGNGILNKNGKASSFQYLGTPENTSISVSGNGAFIGCIYAPSAAMSLSGGGNNEMDFVGSTVTQSASLNGHFNFHYDESLGNTNVVSWAIGSWNEL